MSNPPQTASRINYPCCLFLAAFALACWLIVFYFRRGALVVPFKPLTPQTFAGLIGWLVAVALFVERAVEVVVTACRDQGADLLEIDKHVKTRAALNADAALKKADAAGAAAAATAAAAANDAAQAAQDAITAYRAVTKEFALKVSFGFSFCVAVAGVRALHGLLPDGYATGRLFTVVDLAVTSAMLAGGSEGIHRLANVYTSFADSASSQYDAKNPDKNPALK
jgi:hypothetical protein